MKIRNLAILGGLMIAAGMATVACSGDDDDTSTATDSGVKSDSSTPTDSGTKSDSGTPLTDSSTPTDASDAGIPNHAAVLGFVQSVVTDQIEHNGGAVLSYFVPNTVTGHSPSLPDIEDCLAYQFGAVIGNGDTYPPSFADGGMGDGGAPLADGYQCRASMSAIHQPLGIPGDIFDQFVGDITTEAMIQGVSFTSAQSMEILGLKSYIVDPNAPDGASYGWEDAGDAGDSGH